MFFRVYNLEKISNKALILKFILIYILGFYAKYFDFLGSSRKAARWEERYIHM